VVRDADYGYSYPPDNEDKQKQLGAFFGKYPPPKVAAQIPDYVQAIKDKDSSLSKFGILGVSAHSCTRSGKPYRRIVN
jgi:hypothetical protein